MIKHGQIKYNNKFNIQENILNVKEQPTSFKTVYRIADILTCLTKGIDSVTEIADICQVNKSTIHRLLKAMEQAEMTIQDPISHKHYMGPLIVKAVSAPNVTHEVLISCAIKEMNYLWNLTNETIGLCILTGLRSVLLYQIQCGYEHKIVGKNKVINKLHAGASTKVLLSELSEKELQIAMVNMDFEQITENTISKKAELIEQLKQIKKQGYAISYGERIPGAINISAPISNYIIPAAINILGPESRIKPRVKDFINELMTSRIRICDKLMQVNMVINS